MNKQIIANILLGIVLLGSIMVMFGWFFDINILKSILPIWVSMKFITALSFFASTILILFLSKKEKTEIDNLAILIISSILLLLMFTFFVSLFAGISTGIESLFIKETANAILTTVPGVPAIPTMLCFIFISLIGLISLYDSNLRGVILFFGEVITLIGVVAIIGYLLRIPLLYYFVPGYTAMAAHTALLFVLLGVSIILSKLKGEKI